MLERHTAPAVMMRGGTSKGLFFRSSDLPKDRRAWTNIFLSAMGSPDSYGKQTDGLGGGSSTTSKIAVVGPSSVPGVQVDYTFVAVPLKGDTLDFTGNCGNILSGVGPFAVEEGFVRPNKKDGLVTVTIRNTNTNVIINSTFSLKGGLPVEDGECMIDGVGQPGAPIHLNFLDPAGSMTGTLLPTGNSLDTLSLPENKHSIKSARVSCVDAANPFVFVFAEDLGLKGDETAQQLLDYTDLLLTIRCLGAVKMGLAKSVGEASKTAGTPKVALVGRPRAFSTPAGRSLAAKDMDLHVRPFSMGLPHPSLQMTGAVCLAAACAIPGSVPNLVVQQANSREGEGNKFKSFRFAHASGLVETTAEVEVNEGSVEVRSAAVVRTARRLFKGTICYLGAPVRTTVSHSASPTSKPYIIHKEHVIESAV